MQDRLRELASGEQSAPYAYVTHSDIKSIPELHGDTLIAIKAPPGTELEVPDPDEGMPYGERRYQIFLKSTGGPIDCLLVSQGGPEDYNTGANSNPVLHNTTNIENESGADPSFLGNIVSPIKSSGSVLHDENDLMNVLRLSPSPGNDDFYFGLEDSRDGETGIADLYDEVIAVPDDHQINDVEAGDQGRDGAAHVSKDAAKTKTAAKAD